MKSIAKLLFILLAAAFVSCSSDEPVKEIEADPLGYCKPLEFDYRDIDFRVEIKKYSKNEIKDYFGEIPADGSTFYITHEYPKLCLISGVYLNNQIAFPLRGSIISETAYSIEFNWDGGYAECTAHGRNSNTIKVDITPNDTGAPRNFRIRLDFLSIAVADINLTQESL